MEVRLATRCGARALAPIAGGHVGFHPDDRLYFRVLRLLLKIPGCVQIAVVGDGEGGLFQLLRASNQVVYPVRSIQ